MNVIIFDIEATCWSPNSDNILNECIEIGAITLNKDGSIKNEFQAFIKPLKNPILSDFCKDLTHISQEDINKAQSFDIVLNDFFKWINTDKEYVLASWGYFDLNILTSDSANYKLNPERLKNFINLRKQYHKINDIKGRIGLKKVFENEKLKQDGQLHRALSDAKNLSKLYTKLKYIWDLTSYSKNDLYFYDK